MTTKNWPIEAQGDEIPYVLTHPAQDSKLVQPTLGRIALGVFLGNLATGVVGGIIFAIASL